VEWDERVGDWVRVGSDWVKWVCGPVSGLTMSLRVGEDWKGTTRVPSSTSSAGFGWIGSGGRARV